MNFDFWTLQCSGVFEMNEWIRCGEPGDNELPVFQLSYSENGRSSNLFLFNILLLELHIHFIARSLWPIQKNNFVLIDQSQIISVVVCGFFFDVFIKC